VINLHVAMFCIKYS